MARVLLVALGLWAVWLSPRTAASSLYFDFGDVSVTPGEPLELACGVQGHFRLCVWETQRGDIFQVEDVHAGLYSGLRAPTNLTHNQCGIVVDALTERDFGAWTCRVYLAGSTLRAEKTVGKALDCPGSFTQVGTNCYFFSDSTLSWEQASAYCQELDSSANLAVLDDCYEFQLVWNHILVTYGAVWHWIGGSDRFQEGSWHWVTGEPVAVGTPFWRPGEPTRDGGCLDMSQPYGYFNDYNCSHTGKFVCQILY